MGQIGPLQLLIVAVIVLLLFGRGKIPALMGDLAQGIKNFKRGMAEDKAETADASKTVEHDPAEVKTGTTNTASNT